MQGFSEVFGNLISIPFVKFIGVKKTAILFNAVAGLSMVVTVVMLEIDEKRYESVVQIYSNTFIPVVEPARQLRYTYHC